ncbi:hypothetical protein [Curtobacterium ammoniigenes]|uniref:hypothetical protein n=1 Tax=Curtobacterium ammoniigenes TaxID=395387 RepID=UPI0008366DC3|nr:hypothetical protein [Curtobacterium ammoniigenes]
MSNQERHEPDIEQDAVDLGLALVGEASALHSGDMEAVVASEDNLREVVDELVDEPLTERQEEVVETLAASGASLTAGLAGAVSIEQQRPVGDVLRGASRSIVMQHRKDGEPAAGERDRDADQRRGDATE